jgi:hypothetical protein
MEIFDLRDDVSQEGLQNLRTPISPDPPGEKCEGRLKTTENVNFYVRGMSLTLSTAPPERNVQTRTSCGKPASVVQS